MLTQSEYVKSFQDISHVLWSFHDGRHTGHQGAEPVSDFTWLVA